MYRISIDRKFMGDLVASPFLKISGGIGLLVVLILAVINFIDIFLK
jgi:Mn2+/Fe2+ NRAMP family transporter